MVSKQSFSANKAFYILFAIFALGLYILFSLVTKIAPLTISHTIYYCQKVLSSILLTLPHLAPPLFILVLTSVIFIGLILLAFQMGKTYFFIRKIVGYKIRTSIKVDKIAQELGIINRVDVVKSDSFSSFCYGFIRPRICITLKLTRDLNEGELRAVLTHESYHLKNRDPLKILFSQIATSMFFFVPTLKDIHKYYTLSKEVAADELAIKYTKDLRSALSKLLLGPSPSLSGVASFAADNDLEQRINILTNAEKLSLRISFARLTMSLLVLVAALTVLNMPVYAIEDNHETHSYFICPYGGDCMLSCAKQGIMTEMPFSKDQTFTPANYSPSN